MEGLDELFDTSQYCTLEGSMLIPTISPESEPDSVDFYQLNEQKSLTNSDLINNNMYGDELVGFDPITNNNPLNTNVEFSYNLPFHVMAQRNNSNNNLFTSWKANSAQNHISHQQIDPSSGLPRKICSNCGSISTPSWRRCPEGRNLLCNACGLYQKLHSRPRPLRIREDGSVQVIRNINSATKNMCQNCRTTETPIWRRSQGDRSLMLCNACALYLKNHNSSRPIGLTYNNINNETQN